MDQNHHFWICLISALILNFERLCRSCLFLMKDYFWLKFQQTQAIFQGERAQKSPKSSHFMNAASPWKHFKLYNLTTRNATLMNLTAIIYLHIYLSKWARKSFFGSVSGFFKNKIKTVTFLMHYVALHHWSKFQMNLTTFRWVTSKKPTRSSLKLYFLLVWKHLKFQNLWTANQT